VGNSAGQSRGWDSRHAQVVSDHKFSFSATQSEPVYTYEIELTEIEVLSLDSVEFDGLTLTPAPDQWKLDSDDSALEQHAGTYFPVRLAGMTDGPKPTVDRPLRRLRPAAWPP
jgi:hypothetical protein